MAIPKAKSAAVVGDHEVEKKALIGSFKEAKKVEKLKISPIECLNEFVAILPVTVETHSIILPESAITNEAIVVGVGPGLPSGTVRVPSSLKVGDVILYNPKNHLTSIIPQSGSLKDQTVYIIQERSAYCVLRRIEHEIV